MINQDAPFAFPILVLVGPTAIGKTALSLQIAREYGFEIINMDSMQVYRHMDIGTAKATPEERGQIAHHLISIVDPDENYDAACFRRDALQSISEIQGRGKFPLVTGGTGLYLDALLNGIFPEVPGNREIRNELKKRLKEEGREKLHKELLISDRISAERIHPNDTHRLLRALEIYMVSKKAWSDHLREQRIERKKERARYPQLFQIALTCPREKLYRRIDQRSASMLEMGLEDEVRNLLAMGFSAELKSMRSIGYRHVNDYIAQKYDREEMVRLLARDTRRYAKRQCTWFKRNKELQWIDVENRQEITMAITRWLQGAGK